MKDSHLKAPRQLHSYFKDISYSYIFQERYSINDSSKFIFLLSSCKRVIDTVWIVHTDSFSACLSMCQVVNAISYFCLTICPLIQIYTSAVSEKHLCTGQYLKIYLYFLHWTPIIDLTHIKTHGHLYFYSCWTFDTRDFRHVQSIPVVCRGRPLKSDPQFVQRAG